jgi:hypothetical protein
MHGALPVVLSSCVLAAYVAFDLIKTLKTGRAHARGRVIVTRKNQPDKFRRYVYADYCVLAACLALICWAMFWPDAFP